MRWAMEILSPSSYISNSSSLFLDESMSTTRWTPAENKAFENALALFDENTPDRWRKVASMVPGKTEIDVIRQYKELEDDVSSIEAGLIPVPGYSVSSPFTLEWGSGRHPVYDGFNKQLSYVSGVRKSYSSGRNGDQERKKGVPWTEEEHKLFLMGLEKYGKGDWRNISRNFVITRTPTQVASHAQKYFIRQLSGGKDKRRASIHDITTVNLNEHHHHHTSSPDNNKSNTNNKTPSPDQSSIITTQSKIRKPTYPWNHTTSDEMVLAFGNVLASAAASYGGSVKSSQGQQPYLGSQSSISFEMQSGTYYPSNA